MNGSVEIIQTDSKLTLKESVLSTVCLPIIPSTSTPSIGPCVKLKEILRVFTSYRFYYTNAKLLKLLVWQLPVRTLAALMLQFNFI